MQKELEPIQNKPTISFMSNETELPELPPSNIFTDIKVKQAPYLIPPIYPGVHFVVWKKMLNHVKLLL